MKIAVIAANGRSGKAFAEAALRAGHEVQAGIHNNNTLKPALGLNFLDCDATIELDVIRLIQRQDAVVSFIGHVRDSPPDVQTKATKVIVSAMHRTKKKRFVSLTGTGVRFPKDKVTLLDRLLNFCISIIDPDRVSDGANHARVLMDSDLDWTIIRVLKLRNGKTKKFTLNPVGPTKLFVSRDEVACAVLEVLERHTFVKNAPIIAKAIKNNSS